MYVCVLLTGAGHHQCMLPAQYSDSGRLFVAKNAIFVVDDPHNLLDFYWTLRDFYVPCMKVCSYCDKSNSFCLMHTVDIC